MFDNTYKLSDTDLRVNALWRTVELIQAWANDPSCTAYMSDDDIVATANKFYTFLKGETK